MSAIQQMSMTAAPGPSPSRDRITVSYMAPGNHNNASTGPCYSTANEAAYGYAASISGSYYAAVVCENPDGTVKWAKYLTTPISASSGSKLHAFSDGVVVVFSTGAVMKLSWVDGTTLWRRALSCSTAISMFASDADASAIYVFGTANDGTAGGMIAKLNTDGTAVWSRKYGNSTYSVYSGAADASGNVYACGTAETGTLAFVAKYNSSGTLQWQRKMVTTPQISYYNVAVDASGNVYTVGFTGSSTDGFLVKYNSSGVLQWQKKITSAATMTLALLALRADGAPVVAGATVSGVSGSYIASIDTSGSPIWQRHLGGVTCNSLSSFRVSGAVFAIGGVKPGSPQRGALFQAPVAGTKIGTYTIDGSSVIYTPASFTFAAGSGTDSAAAASDAALTVTNAAGAQTLSDLTLSGHEVLYI